MHLRLPVALIIAVSLATAATPAPRPQISWGKAGVSFEEYRRDAIECGRMGHNVDVSDTPQAKALVRASRRLEAADNQGMTQMGEGGESLAQVSGGPDGVSDVSPAQVDSFAAAARYAANTERIRAGARPERQIASLKVAMEDIVARCLIDRGYSRYALTAEQRKVLRRLRKGSDRRHAYLHSLASDPAVLEQQALEGA